jgi:hypothetical protein
MASPVVFSQTQPSKVTVAATGAKQMYVTSSLQHPVGVKGAMLIGDSYATLKIGAGIGIHVEAYDVNSVPIKDTSALGLHFEGY